MRRLLQFCLFALLATPSWGACSGSGLVWSCASGSTSTDIQGAIAGVTSGGTITLANGTYNSWDVTDANSNKAYSLVCASVGGCTANWTTNMFHYEFNGSVSGLIRVSGFVFQQSGSTATNGIWFDPDGGTNNTTNNYTLSQIRVDHNTFNLTATSEQVVFLGEQTHFAHFFGVADHNSATCACSFIFAQWVGDVDQQLPPNPVGTGNEFYVEDNTIITTNVTSTGAGCVDIWGGSSAIVYRYNKETDCLITAHTTDHRGGPIVFEVYGNQTTMDAASVSQYGGACYRCYHIQGAGVNLVWGNTFTPNPGSGHDTRALSVLHYRDYTQATTGDFIAGLSIPFPGTTVGFQCDGTVSGPSPDTWVVDGNQAGSDSVTGLAYQGYPCWRQPGRDPASGNLWPLYEWNNKWGDTGTQIVVNTEDLGGSPDYKANHIAQNRDYYDAVSLTAQTSSTSPFSGATGMGVGTLANRPTSCTPTRNSFDAGHGGVGYWATDQGTWNQAPDASYNGFGSGSGVLYSCTASNTWASIYTPYTYPHPLVGAAPASAGGSAISGASVAAGQTVQ